MPRLMVHTGDGSSDKVKMTNSCCISTLPTKIQTDLLSWWDRQWHPSWEEILYSCPLSSISLTVAHWPLLTSLSEDCALQYNNILESSSLNTAYCRVRIFLTYFHSLQTITFQGSAGCFFPFFFFLKLASKTLHDSVIFLPTLLLQCILTETNISMSPYKESRP